MSIKQSAGIVVDDYKVEHFKNQLTEAGYSFKEKAGVTPNTKTLIVEFYTQDFNKLSKFIEKLNTEAILSKTKNKA